MEAKAITQKRAELRNFRRAAIACTLFIVSLFVTIFVVVQMTGGSI
jgi:hypothetical protein